MNSLDSVGFFFWQLVSLFGRLVMFSVFLWWVRLWVLWVVLCVWVVLMILLVIVLVLFGFFCRNFFSCWLNVFFMVGCIFELISFFLVWLEKFGLGIFIDSIVIMFLCMLLLVRLILVCLVMLFCLMQLLSIWVSVLWKLVRWVLLFFCGMLLVKQYIVFWQELVYCNVIFMVMLLDLLVIEIMFGCSGVFNWVRCFMKLWMLFLQWKLLCWLLLCLLIRMILMLELRNDSLCR